MCQRSVGQAAVKGKGQESDVGLTAVRRREGRKTGEEELQTAAQSGKPPARLMAVSRQKSLSRLPVLQERAETNTPSQLSHRLARPAGSRGPRAQQQSALGSFSSGVEGDGHIHITAPTLNP